MKIIVLSDTHGNYPLAIRAIDQVSDVDYIIHLGDEMADASIIEDIAGATIIKVPGNCDPQTMVPRELQKTLAGKKFFITHGDRYYVKGGLGRLHRKALTERAHVVLYGHTHVASVEIIDGIFFINPGCMAKGGGTGSYAVISIQSGTITADIATIAV
jgi:putative phosphoesterase